MKTNHHKLPAADLITAFIGILVCLLLFYLANLIGGAIPVLG